MNKRWPAVLVCTSLIVVTDAPYAQAAARAEAQAIIREQGAIVDEQQWARNVDIESTL